MKKKVIIALLIILNCGININNVRSEDEFPLTVEMDNYYVSNSYAVFHVHGGVGDWTLILANPTPIVSYNESIFTLYEYRTAKPSYWNESEYGIFPGNGVYISVGYCRDLPANWTSVYISAVSIESSTSELLELIHIHYEPNPVYNCPLPEEDQTNTSENSHVPQEDTQNDKQEPLSLTTKIVLSIIGGVGLINIVKSKLRKTQNKPVSNIVEKNNPDPSKKKKKKSWNKLNEKEKKEHLKTRFPDLN